LPGLGLPDKTPVEVDYSEGADVGYRAFARSGEKPLFPFGHGLSYSKFSLSGLSAVRGEKLRLSFTIRNVGDRAGADVPQLYMVGRNGERLQRLIGFQRVMLNPGESRAITVTVDDRLLANWGDGQWSMPAGSYSFALGEDAERLEKPVTIRLREKHWKD